MHIALVNQWYPPETGGGGVATHNFHFARACVQLGHQVTVIASRLKPETQAISERDGVRIIRILSPNLYRWRRLPLLGRQYRYVQAVLYSRLACQALGELNRQSPVDIAEFAEVNAEGAFWRPELSVRLAVRCHTPAWILARYYSAAEAPYDVTLLGRAEKNVIRRAQVRTAPSRALAQIITQECGLPADSVSTIPNALDTAALKPSYRNRRTDQVTVLWVGRVERAKGADVLIASIPPLCARFPQLRFVVVGGSRSHPEGGSYHDYMCKHLADQVASGQLEIRGFVPDEQMAAVYGESDISVVPSVLYESFSFTVAQSMAFGLPVVTTRVGGIPETIDQGRCGVLVEPGNVEQFVEAVSGLVLDRPRRLTLGAAAREFAETHFAAERVAARTLEFYEQALRR